MPTSKVDKFVAGLTTTETKDCAVASLQQLSQDDAWEVIRDWIVENDMMEDTSIWCDENMKKGAD